MKKKLEKKDRILGRRVAKEMTREEMENTRGALATWSLSDPPDRDRR